MADKKLRDEVIKLIAKTTEKGMTKGSARVSFSEGIDVDSLMALEIVAALEERYKIEITEEDLPQLGTLDGMVSIVERLIKERPAEKADTKEAKAAAENKRKPVKVKKKTLPAKKRPVKRKKKAK